MAIPAFRAAGSAAYSANSVTNPTNLSATAPAGRVAGDLLVCITASRSITATVSTPSGWNIVSGFPKRSGTASGGSIYAFTRIADGTASDNCAPSWSGVATGTTGDSSSARILAFQNALQTADGTPPVPADAAATTTITIPAHTTGNPNSLVVGVAIRINDTAHTFTVATFTERSDDHTTTGTGHGTVVAEKIQTAAGSSGTAAVTPSNSTSSRTLAVSFGVRGAPTSVALTNAAETDAAQALVVRKPIRKTLISATEADAAQALVVRKPIRKSLTAATEAGSAQALSVTKPIRKTLTPASEADAAQALGFTKPIRKSLTAASESDGATALTAAKRATLTAAAETDSPVARTAVHSVTLTPAQEADSAQALDVTKPIFKGLTPASEADSTNALAPAKRVGLNAATEADLAESLSFTKPIFVSFTPAEETGEVVELDVSKPIQKSLVAATETGEAADLSVTHVHYRDIAPAQESDEALGLDYSIEGGPTFVSLTPATETSTAQVLRVRKALGFTPAAEADAAVAVGLVKRARLAPAAESDTALVLVHAGLVVHRTGPEGSSTVRGTAGSAGTLRAPTGQQKAHEEPPRGSSEVGIGNGGSTRVAGRERRMSVTTR